MKPINLSRISILALVLVAVLLLSAIWYLGFYEPLNESLAQIRLQSVQTDNMLSAAAARVAAMETMKGKLKQVSDSDPRIAPYDNKQAVLRELNRILEHTPDYSLQFQEPTVREDGIARRVVVMQVRCSNISQAQEILSQLESGPWFCLLRDISLSGTENILSGDVLLHATLVFPESTRLK